jgi:hypothetical protein
MSHRVLAALLVTIVLCASAVPTGAAAQASGDSAARTPVIRLSLDRDGYEAGDWAVVLVTTREDGYVVALQVDGDGAVHAIFPASPGADAFVRGGDMAVRDAHGKSSFQVKGSSGSGLVYAAYSRVPFNFAAFTRHGRWSIAGAEDSLLASDPGRALAAIVQRMSTGPFNDDLVRYEIAGPVSLASLAPEAEPIVSSGYSYGGCGIDAGSADPADAYGYGCDPIGGGVTVCGGCGDPVTPAAPAPPPRPASPPRPPLLLGGPRTAPRVPYKPPLLVDLVAESKPAPATPPSVAADLPARAEPLLPPRPEAPRAPEPRSEPPRVEPHFAVPVAAPAPTAAPRPSPPPPPPAPPPPSPPPAPALVPKPPHSL